MRRVVIAAAAIALLGSVDAARGDLRGPAGRMFAAVVHAQEGHPLTGTWSGDWWTAAGERTHITMVMEWNGKAVTGTLNPGPDQAPLTVATLDPANWTVHIEADLPMGGRPVHVAADGKLEDIASYHRTLSGTWMQGTTSGTFRLVRD